MNEKVITPPMFNNLCPPETNFATADEVFVVVFEVVEARDDVLLGRLDFSVG
jgi:hypothetical protein